MVFVEVNSSKNTNDLTTINKIQNLKVQDLKVNNIVEKLNSNSHGNFDKLMQILQQIPDDFNEIDFAQGYFIGKPQQ